VFNNWFRPDVIELEKRVTNLERALILMNSYYAEMLARDDADIRKMAENQFRMAQAIANSQRPFPFQSDN
jgi:hypothetical protein